MLFCYVHEKEKFIYAISASFLSVVFKKLVCNRSMSYFPSNEELCIFLLKDTFKFISVCKGSVI